jgi:hypothetical protein
MKEFSLLFVLQAKKRGRYEHPFLFYSIAHRQDFFHDEAGVHF